MILFHFSACSFIVSFFWKFIEEELKNFMAKLFALRDFGDWSGFNGFLERIFEFFWKFGLKSSLKWRLK